MTNLHDFGWWLLMPIYKLVLWIGATIAIPFNDAIAIPTTILFFAAAILLTIKTGFVQIRAFPRFISLITQGIGHRKHGGRKYGDSISPFQALFTAMGTTIGMGNVVGPAVAIYMGGPGALFWLVFCIIVGSVLKFVEVVFAVKTREILPDGRIIGGPMQYLKNIHPFLAVWYGVIMSCLFMAWSALQSNTMAAILEQEHVSQWIVGLGLALFVFVVLQGGAHRVGHIASKLVPFMFVLYCTFTIVILFKNSMYVPGAFYLVFSSAFSPIAALSGFVGATVAQAMQAGFLRGVLISESGLGTSSIAHSVSDAKRASDQGVLALYSTVADALLSTLSGLVALVTGVWLYGGFRSTLIYEAFKMQAPVYGQYILLSSIVLFVLTTVMGNSFNGTQTFAWLTQDRASKLYILATVLFIFIGALVPVNIMWGIVDMGLILVAIPNLIGIVFLAFRSPEVLALEEK